MKSENSDTMGNHNNSLKIFGCRATQYLAGKIADSLDVDLGKSSCPVFADGEFEPCYEETIRGSHVFIVQSTPPPADNLLELLLMIGLGIAYMAIGIYGYAFAVRSGKLHYHLAYFAIQLLLGGMIVFLGKGAGFNAMVLLPLAGHSVVLLPRSWRLAVNIAIVGTYALALNPPGVNNWGMIWSGMPLFLAGQIFIVVFTQMAVSEEKARAEVELLVKELEEANQRLREYSLQVEELTITKERNRLVRQIGFQHDALHFGFIRNPDNLIDKKGPFFEPFVAIDKDALAEHPLVKLESGNVFKTADLGEFQSRRLDRFLRD